MANRKNAIIEATIRRISTQGDTFSTSQIAEDVGCSQALVFRYYRTKEGLMSACFDSICHELVTVLRSVETPDNPDTEKVNLYAISVWEAYCGYLASKSHTARAFMFFVNRGMRFPRGYRTPEDVIRKILGEAYGPIMKVYPDFVFVADYIIVFSYVAATGLFEVHDIDTEEIMEKLDRIMRYGILGYGRGE